MKPKRLRRLAPHEQVTLGPIDVNPQDPDAPAFVANAEIGDGWLHPAASNYTFVVELSLDGRHAHGVYKPKAGEAPLWDFPDGTLYLRECAAYELSRLLDWNLIPPTLVRDGELGVGSLQLFVQPKPDSNYFTLRDAHRDAVIRMAVFDMVANNADRKGGHCFVGATGGVWGVDNGLTFNVQHKLRTVIWDFAGEAVPRERLEDLCRLLEALERLDSPATERLSQFISPTEAEALRRRIRRIIDNPVLPEPRSRRDLPWPWM